MESLIVPITNLSADALQPLIDESRSEGYGFVQTLLDEYVSGTNRFETAGAVLFGVYRNQQMIAIGGVQQDPYLGRADVGRIRHVYVLSDYRRHGIGKLLLDALTEKARAHFTLLTLRTNTQAAATFYEALGFSSEPVVAEATHWLELQPPQ